METQFRRTSGFCLLTGSVLATLTMILHPLGGGLAEIAHTKNIFLFSHSIAILAIPFIAFGFWGLSTALVTKSRVSFLAFCIICFGLVAVMIAGAFDGVVLPLFASRYWNSDIDATFLQVVRNYGKYINLCMDYIFIAAITLSVLIWSVVIVTTAQLPKWLGYYGLLLVAVIATCLVFNLNLTSVFRFSLFIFGIVSWKVLASILLIISAKN